MKKYQNALFTFDCCFILQNIIIWCSFAALTNNITSTFTYINISIDFISLNQCLQHQTRGNNSNLKAMQKKLSENHAYGYSICPYNLYVRRIYLRTHSHIFRLSLKNSQYNDVIDFVCLSLKCERVCQQHGMLFMVM